MKTKNSILPLILFTMNAMIGALMVKSAAAESDSDQKKGKSDSYQSIEEFTKDKKAVPGLFDLYQNHETGELFIKIKRQQLNKEYIYSSVVVDGPEALGFFRGKYSENYIFTISRYFDRLEFVQENPHFYYGSASSLHRVKHANINRPVLASLKIVAKDKKDDAFIAKADGIFLKEALAQISHSPDPKQKKPSTYSLGKLSGKKSKYIDIKNYPANSAVTVDYVFDNPTPNRVSARADNGGHVALSNLRYITVRYLHHLIEWDNPNYEPRLADPRVGYFTSAKNDMLTTDITSHRDMIRRWHLEKKYPGKALSEPVQPIVFWIENSTPVDLREDIKEGVLAWNKSFEKAGFENAIEVKIQPDDADWTAGDIRYHVIRWQASPRPQYSGYGPSHSDPRTGEIISADIMLEWNSIRRLNLRAFIKESDASGHDLHHPGHELCLAELNAAESLLAARSHDLSEDQQKALRKDWIQALVLHEVGHVLGLTHNMKASSLLTIEQLHDKAYTQKHGMSASVMDYMPLHFAFPGYTQGHYATVVPGVYDDWAIEFGYKPLTGDESEQLKQRNTILSRSTEPGLALGNDADDMRSIGTAIDPVAMIWDFSSDPVKYATLKMDQINARKEQMLERHTRQGESYNELFRIFNQAMQMYGRQLQVINNYIGGIRVDRAFVGQKGAQPPFTVVDEKEQRAAMQILARYAFAKDSLFAKDSELYRYLQQQRRGFNFYGIPQDPQIHEMILKIQQRLLDHFFHANVIARMSNSALYGNGYTYSEVLTDLTAAIFKDDAKSNVSSMRQNLQREYVKRLINLYEDSKQRVAQGQSAAYYQLDKIRDMLSSRRNDESSKAHKQFIQHRIEKSFWSGQAK